VVGQKFTILMDEHAAQRHEGPNGYLAQYNRMARKGHQLAVGNSRQLLAKRKDGASVPITLTVDMYTSKAGQQVYIAVLTCVTQEINLQQELHKSKDTFLSTMSHELRTPLFGLLGMMSMMRLPTDEEASREVRQMEACTTSLLSIVNNMIDFYKLENLAVTPLYVPFQPRVLLAEVIWSLLSPFLY
jgi:signal transduction histidine kinase